MTVQTKYGTAGISDDGYYRIYSKKEGNHMKLLHRLIFEDFYQTELPSDWIIHHEDGNKLNNEIWNLIPMTKQEHVEIHHKGKIVSFERDENGRRRHLTPTYEEITFAEYKKRYPKHYKYFTKLFKEGVKE